MKLKTWERKCDTVEFGEKISEEKTNKGKHSDDQPGPMATVLLRNVKEDRIEYMTK